MQILLSVKGRGCGGVKFFLVDFLGFHAILRRNFFLKILGQNFSKSHKICTSTDTFESFLSIFSKKNSGKIQKSVLRFFHKLQLKVEVVQLKVSDFFSAFR